MAGIFLSSVGIAVMVWGVARRWLFGVGTLLMVLSTVMMIIATRADRLFFARSIRHVLRTPPYRSLSPSR